MKTLFLASLIYTPITIIRNYLYDFNILKARRLPVPVISVGNITAGGTGKSPMVITIGEILKNAGKTFGVLSRGYKRSSIKPYAISSREGLGASEIGDEPMMIGQRLGCPLGIASDRYRIGRILIGKFGPEVLILDDGFSHRRLARDLNLLLIDESDPWGGGMLPYGKRRETLANISRADAIIITRDHDATDDAPIRDKLKKLKFNRPVFTARRRPECIVTPDGTVHPFSAYKDRGCYLFSGIAKPERFFNMATRFDLKVKGTISYPDHFIFDRSEMDRIKDNSHGALLLTTEKDFWRLDDLNKDVHFLRIAIQFDQMEPFCDFIVNSIFPHAV
jgi:tetraacyldisaccharide 4'-kinase